MKLNKSLYLAAALAGGFLAAACSSDGYWDKADVKSLEAYTFNATSSSFTYGPEDEMTDIDVVVTRSVAGEAFTLPITAEFSDSSLIIGPNPSSVTFAAGENQATYTIKVQKQFELGESAKATLTIDPTSVGITAVKQPTAPKELADSTLEKMTEEEQAVAKKAYALADSLYKDSLVDYNTYIKRLASYKLSTTVSLLKDYPWKSLGMATVTDDLLGPLYGEDPVKWKVEIRENGLIPGWYRLVNPYNTLDYPYNAAGDFDDSKDYYFDLHAEDPDFVWFGRTPLGVNWGDGMAYAYSFASYYMDRGNAADAVKAAGYGGTLKDGEITFPTRGLLMGFEGASGLYYANNSGLFSVLLPGYVKADYSLAVAYKGLFSNIEGQDSTAVLADVEAGSDFEELKALVWSREDDAAAVADAVAAGELDALTIQPGRIEVPFDTEELNGKLQLIIIGLAGGEAKAVATANFEFYSGADPWTSLGKGYFTDDIVLTSYYAMNAPTYEVEIQENSTTPGLYRLVDPYAEGVYPYTSSQMGKTLAPAGMSLEVNAEDPEGVYVALQPLGMDWGDGAMSFESAGAYYLQKYEFDVVKRNNLFGTLADGVITFPHLSYTYKDDNGEEQTAYWQGNIYVGSSAYDAGASGNIKIVLPGASAGVKATAAAKARATQFESQLKPRSIRQSGNRTFGKNAVLAKTMRPNVETLRVR